MTVIKINGIYSHEKIVLDETRTIEWKELTDEEPPRMPFGCSIELTIAYDVNDFLHGKNGIVWGTYELMQAEIIRDALIAQNISAEMKRLEFPKANLFLVSIINKADIVEAIDYIWKSNHGLRLKPDWTYPNGEVNESFEQWLSGH
ncbi:MAG TPA: hypothetical protein VKA08_10375 [Balneolales bacterium]|nr:hypothetical protein [Balneolales bacterium]